MRENLQRGHALSLHAAEWSSRKGVLVGQSFSLTQLGLADDNVAGEDVGAGGGGAKASSTHPKSIRLEAVGKDARHQSWDKPTLWRAAPETMRRHMTALAEHAREWPEWRAMLDDHQAWPGSYSPTFKNRSYFTELFACFRGLGGSRNSVWNSRTRAEYFVM